MQVEDLPFHALLAFHTEANPWFLVHGTLSGVLIPAGSSLIAFGHISDGITLYQSATEINFLDHGIRMIDPIEHLIQTMHGDLLTVNINTGQPGGD